MIIIEAVLLIYFSLVTLYTLVMAVAGLFTINPYHPKTDTFNRIAVLIPAYKEDQVIIATAESALEQEYPKDKYTVAVIADSLQPETVETLKKLPIEVVEVAFENSAKEKSLRAALDYLGDKYDIALVLDADNIMGEGFLSKINTAFNSGYEAIQGRRVAKNMNTPFAVLDTISEVINNHIYRQGHVALGLSSAVIGSGMAFEYHSFKEIVNAIDAVGAEDRVIEMSYLERGKRIIYLRDAVVYDEKIESAKHFHNQRKRWLSSHFGYLIEFFPKGVKMLLKGNLDYFNIAVIHGFILPRILTLGFLTIFAILAVILRDMLALPFYWWMVLFGVYVLTFFISIPGRLYNMKLVTAVLYLPQAFFMMFLSLLKHRGANRKFIHTPHSSTEVDKSLTDKE